MSATEEKLSSLMIERPQITNATWDALRAHIVQEKQRKKDKALMPNMNDLNPRRYEEQNDETISVICPNLAADTSKPLSASPAGLSRQDAKTLAAQNITTLIDAAFTLSVQSSSVADGIKIPRTKEELELVQASLVAEAQLIYSIQNRQEDIRFEESSLTVLDSEERQIILDIGSHMVDNEVPKTLGTGGGDYDVGRWG